MPTSHYFSRYYGVTRDVSKAKVRCKWAVFDNFPMMPFGPCPTPPGPRFNTKLRSFKRRGLHYRRPLTKALWQLIVLVKITCFELIDYYLTWVPKWRSALTHTTPESLWSSFFQAHSFQFMCKASRGVPLSPLSPRCPFCPVEPWIPGSPFAPFFPSAPRAPGCPSLLWLHLDQVPQGFWDARQVCPHPCLSAIITRWTRKNRLPKREKSMTHLSNFRWPII